MERTLVIAKVVAKAIVQNNEGKVLLLRRSASDDRRPGEWDFPGGGIEAGEDVAAGVAREIIEEAGLEVPIDGLRLVYAKTEVYKDKESVTRLLFAAKVSNNSVVLSFEHDEYDWLHIDAALTEFPHPFYGTGLRYARDNDLLG